MAFPATVIGFSRTRQLLSWKLCHRSDASSFPAAHPHALAAEAAWIALYHR